MDETQLTELKVGIPAGWEQRGKGYYCRSTKQEFETLGALLQYVSYANCRQPELFELWSSVASHQKKSGRKRKNGSNFTSTSGAEGDDPGQEQSLENICKEQAKLGCERGSSSAKSDIIYERRCKSITHSPRNSGINAKSTQKHVPNV